MINQTETQHDLREEFLYGFAATVGIRGPDWHRAAETQWQHYSQRMTDAERQAIEAGGWQAGEEHGRYARLTDYAMLSNAPTAAQAQAYPRGRWTTTNPAAISETKLS